MAAKPHTTAVSMNETIAPGPAPTWLAPPPMTSPRLEKMPAPMMAPTPSIVRSKAVSVRLSWRPGSSASAIRSSARLRRRKEVIATARSSSRAKVSIPGDAEQDRGVAEQAVAEGAEGARDLARQGEAAAPEEVVAAAADEADAA